MRKPRPLTGFRGLAPQISEWRNHIWIASSAITPEEAERLAAWLLKAAEWIREKEARR